MSSLNDDFNELIRRIRYGRELDHASFEPVYYLIFDPKQILEVKRNLRTWIIRLHNDGWDADTFSIAENVIEILQNSPLRELWVAADRKAPLAWEKANQSLANVLTNGSLESLLMDRLEQLQERDNAILLVTDMEALHPYLRIGSIESKLQSKFKVPTIFLYPGERAGKTQLKFLGFYPEDGNYRSVHVGG